MNTDRCRKAAKSKGQSSTDDWPFDLSRRGALRPSAFQELLQFPGPRRVAEFAERLGFDLAYAFARDGEAPADLFGCALAAVRVEAEMHLNDLLLAEAETISIGGLLEFKNGYLAQPSNKIQTEKISKIVSDPTTSIMDMVRHEILFHF